MVNVLLLLLLASSLAIGYVLVRMLEGQFPSLVIAGGRALIAAAVVLPLCIVLRRPIGPVLRKSGIIAVIAMIGVGLLWGTVAIGERQVDPDLTTLMVSIVPIATLIIIALPPLRRRIWWPAWLGAGLATAGLTIAIGPAQIIDEPSALASVLLITAGFVGFAVGNVLAEVRTGGLSGMAVGGMVMLYASIMLWILAFLLESPLAARPTGMAWVYLVLLGIIGSAVPVAVQFSLVQRAGAAFTSLYGYLLPVFGALFAWALLGTDPSRMLWVGAPVTLAGICVLRWAQRRGRTAAPAPE